MAEKNGHHSGEPWLDEQGRLHETDESVANKCLTLASMIVVEHPNSSMVVTVKSEWLVVFEC